MNSRPRLITALRDALDEDERWTIKLERLLAELDGWHADRRCSVGTERSRAALFWVLVGVVFTIVYACRCPLRRRAAPASAAPR